MHYMLRACLIHDGFKFTEPFENQAALNDEYNATMKRARAAGYTVTTVQAIVIIHPDPECCPEVFIPVPEALEPHFDREFEGAIEVEQLAHMVLEKLRREGIVPRGNPEKN